MVNKNSLFKRVLNCLHLYIHTAKKMLPPIQIKKYNYKTKLLLFFKPLKSSLLTIYFPFSSKY